VVIAFATVTILGTLLLMLPISARQGSTNLLDALFTSTSAVTVTGLAVRDTSVHWSGFGKGVIMLLIQFGGFGIMTGASVVALFLSRQLGLRQRMFTQAETGTVSLGDIRRIVKAIAVVTLTVEFLTAVVLTFRFRATDDLNLWTAGRYGLFHAVSAFNNAGFSLYSDSLARFSGDIWILGPIAFALVVGGLGFPVLLDLVDSPRHPRRWSLHTKLTLGVTAALIVGAFVAILVLEWSNPGTFGPMGVGDKLVNGGFHALTPRTAGFNVVNVGAMDDSTLLVHDGLMLVGAGAASTGGGIKVSTFGLLAFVIWAEIRGRQDVTIFERRISLSLQRQAITVALVSVGLVLGAAITIARLSSITQSQAVFEVTSAFGTVGLSTGVTPHLSAISQLIIVGIMFTGRVGILTLGTALVMNLKPPLYRYPEEGLVIG